ncbi:MAG: hypothetical protein ACD_58C00032G0001 [uncultured bacterium]|nr:MAG: hypothetical protein ACD_58C00032G0001 [uncultured bacterium]
MYLCSGRGSNITDVYMLDFKRQHDTATGLNYVVLTGISPKKMNLIERLHSCLSAAIILNATLAIDKAI